VIGFGQRRREVLFLLAPSRSFWRCACARLRSQCPLSLADVSFLLIVVAAGCVELARRVRWARYVVPCLVLLHAASSLHAFQLSFLCKRVLGRPDTSLQISSLAGHWTIVPSSEGLHGSASRPPLLLLTDWYWDPVFTASLHYNRLSSANRIRHD